MNEFDRAKIQKDRPHYVRDSNRTGYEGSVKDPRWCHDYGPQKKTDPKTKARIMAAMERMKEVLG